MSGFALKGPFSLNFDAIEDEVVEGCPAVFALGFTDNLGRFCITYVGSAGRELKSVLRGLIGTSQQFKFLHMPEHEAAFAKECELFHQFRPLGNFLHPERLAGSHWKCPRCQRG
ncbi:MAG: hypothetical protein ABL907_07825 [Hyphomicrobium sp.]